MQYPPSVPKTPPPRPPDPSPLNALKSTPSNRGTARCHDLLPGFRVDDVSPFIMADIKNHDTCTVEQLLTALLIRCQADPLETPRNLLKSCIEAVLPICNGILTEDEKLNAKQNKYIGKGRKVLRDSLQQYCDSTKEAHRYEPFTLAFNSALQELRELDIPFLRPPSDLHIMFHCNDPAVVSAVHDGMRSWRKPDLVILALDHARAAYDPEDTAPWEDIALHHALNRPKNAFSWEHMLSSLELRSNGQVLAGLPRFYEIKSVTHKAPQSFAGMEAELDLAKTMASSSSAIPTDPKDTILPSSSPNKTRLVGKSTITEQTPSARRSPRGHKMSLVEKRSAPEKEPPLTSSSKKRKLDYSVPLKRLPAMVQCAMYGAERLSHACWIWNTINMVVIDRVAYVWYYDNERAIQSAGIDFVEDLPYFLVLLLALLRFSPEDWGENLQLKDATRDKPFVFSRPTKNVNLDIENQELENAFCLEPPIPFQPVQVKLDFNDRLREHFGLTGRASQVMGASSDSVDPRDPTRTLEGVNLVAKIYHPEKARLNEVHIINHAYKKGEGDPDVANHLPDIICSVDFPRFSTDKIRRDLGIFDPSREKSTRIPRLIIFLRYCPITDLHGEQFWNAFWQCFRCHYRLWLYGIEHGDISPANLMYDRERKMAKLNDFDLAHVRGHPKPSGWERTGTMPFMAVELLTEEAWNGQVERLYRHDCESFAWVLVWISARYDEGGLISNPPFSDWQALDHADCYKAKYTADFSKVHFTSTHQSHWKPGVILLLTIIGNKTFSMLDTILEVANQGYPEAQAAFLNYWKKLLSDKKIDGEPWQGLKLD